ncbi:glycoside hydrolase superfamily [Tribonema minus]|uniref:Glycoside hydrolase superfamily n=1 Tax=Tribonema minus TaxID=303371 RepID=A0A836CC66_9STRA|nr:glycoside hydrolase superfamily [Tribonema minus]
MRWAQAAAALAGCCLLGGTGAADPTCDQGILNKDQTACCPLECTTCGGPGCNALPGGAEACCTSAVLNSGRQCSVDDAPCAVAAAPAPAGEVERALKKHVNVRRATDIGVLPGPKMSYKERQKAYDVKFDSILLYVDVRNLNFNMLRPYFKANKKVQLVIEFGDTFPNILKKKYDKRLRVFGKKAREAGEQVTLRLLHEFNGSWYKWCVYAPNTGNTMANFKQAYKHVVNVLRKTKADFKFQFSYAMRNGLKPGSLTERYDTPAADFYKGLENYVDEVMVSTYNLCGAKDFTGSNMSFTKLFRPWYDQFVAMTKKKPKGIGVAEMGSTGNCGGPGSKVQWITEAWDALIGTFPKVTTFNWFFEDKPQNKRDWDLKTKAEIKAFHNGYDKFKSKTTPIKPPSKPGKGNKRYVQRKNRDVRRRQDVPVEV